MEELGVQGLEGELGEGTHHVLDAQVLPEEDRENGGQSSCEEEENR